MSTQVLTTSTIAQAESRGPALRPMPFWQSLLYFFIPALLSVLAFSFFRSWLHNQGYDPLTSLLAAMTIPLALLFAAALVTYHRVDGYPLNWTTFSQRMRFPHLTFHQVLWSLGLFAACMLGYGLFSQIGLALVNAGLVALPANLPILVDPRAIFTIATLEQAAGGTIVGRWDIVALYLVFFFFNIVGEELWWRGYILPRQELVHGRATWLVHGLLWALFHVYKWWDIIGLLPVCLLISFTAQHLRTNWPGLIAHALFNGLSLVLIIVVVAGL
jgi:membrane protease YdiL (CAAX protease family)